MSVVNPCPQKKSQPIRAHVTSAGKATFMLSFTSLHTSPRRLPLFVVKEVTSLIDSPHVGSIILICRLLPPNIKFQLHDHLLFDRRAFGEGRNDGASWASSPDGQA